MSQSTIMNVAVTMYTFINIQKTSVFMKGLGYAVIGCKALDTVKSCTDKFVELGKKDIEVNKKIKSKIIDAEIKKNE